MKRIQKILLGLIIVTATGLLPLAAQWADPSDNLAMLDKAWAAWEDSKKVKAAALSQGRGENDADTRRAQVEQMGGDTERQAWENARTRLESLIYFVPPTNVIISASAFDGGTKSWVFTVASTDPTVPYKGDVAYSIAGAKEIEPVFTPIDTAIKAATLSAAISYRVTTGANGRCHIGNLRLMILANSQDTAENALVPRLELPTLGWDFTAKNRANPVTTRLLEMVSVLGGTFQMGGNDSLPIHPVTLSDYRIGKMAVTQAQWQIVMGRNPSKFTGGADAPERPVEQVSWNDAVIFCDRLSVMEGLRPVYTITGTSVSWNVTANGYRLPTEAEWEYAARGGVIGGKDNFDFAGSKNIDDVAWYRGNSNSKTHPVGQKKSNQLGLYDMSGNVWQWCWDWFGNYNSVALADPAGPPLGTERVFRGGGWMFNARHARCTDRGGDAPEYQSDDIGFRVVCPPLQ